MAALAEVGGVTEGLGALAVSPEEEEDTDWKGAQKRGTEAFARGDMSLADHEFRVAIARLCPVILGDGHAMDMDGVDEVPEYESWTRRSAAKLLCCRAAALLRMHRHGDALVIAQKASELAPAWAKPAMQVAKCRFGLRQYDQALKACDAEVLQDPPELRAAARALRETIEKKAYGKVVSDGTVDAAPLKRADGTTQGFTADPAEWHDAALLLPERAKDMLADILARCDDDDAAALLAEAHAKVERDGEATRDDVMCPLMIKLQADVLHGDYGYPAGEAGVAKFGAEMRKSIRGFPDDHEFRGLVDDLVRVAAPRRIGPADPQEPVTLYGGM